MFPVQHHKERSGGHTNGQIQNGLKSVENLKRD